MRVASLKNLYFDMDDVLADFSAEKNAVKRFRKEENFFYNLAPIKNNCYALQQAIIKNGGNNIYILSKSPNKRCNVDKLKWLQKNFVGLQEKNIIFVPLKKSKVDYARKHLGLKPTEKLQGTLFDDYNKNCFEWTTSEKVQGSAFIIGNKDEYSLLHTLQMLEII